METRWREHNNYVHHSEPAKHLNESIQHNYNWAILTNASKHTGTRKNLQAIYIVLLTPKVKDQLKPNRPHLFRNGMT